MNTRYITLDEFLAYTGIDLKSKLKSDDNPSRTAEAFLKRCTDRLEAYVEANYHKRIENIYNRELTDYQKEKYKLALIEQALYVFQNGDISVDSGYDPDKGIVSSRHNLKQLAIAPNAINYLLLCGVLTRKVRAKGGFEWGGGWL